MNELQEMQDRIAQLEEETHNRVAQLEEENTALKSKGKAQAMRQRFVLGLAVIGVGLTFMTYKGNTQNTESTVLVCKQIKIIDAARRVRLSIGTTADSEGIIDVFNSQNRRIVSISGSVQTGAGIVSLYDEVGRRMVSLSSSDAKGIVWTQK